MGTIKNEDYVEKPVYQFPESQSYSGKLQSAELINPIPIKNISDERPYKVHTESIAGVAVHTFALPIPEGKKWKILAITIDSGASTLSSAYFNPYVPGTSTQMRISLMNESTAYSGYVTWQPNFVLQIISSLSDIVVTTAAVATSVIRVLYQENEYNPNYQI